MYKTKQENISGPLMELFIETLTGSSMMLHVSPLDTVLDVKTYIQKLEGIPASQQHLVWQSSELDDGQSLQDCHICSGSTLRLVLNMRGGPINTRRVPVEEPSLVEYFTEASRSDLLSSASSRHRPVTVVVCQSGDQLKFYQLMPGTDMSPALSCSQSSSEDDLEVDKDVAKPTKERREENRRTRDKMKLVRPQMEKCSLLKEKKDKLPPTKSLLPRPPATGHPGVINRLRHLSSGTSKKPALLDIDDRPCVPLPALPVTTQLSPCLELSREKDLLSLQTAGTGTLSGGMHPAVDKANTSQELEVPEAGMKSSNVPRSPTSEYSLPCEAENKRVILEDNTRHSEVKIVSAAAEPETKTTSASHSLAVVESSELSIGHGRIKPVDKLVKTVESTTEARPTHCSKSQTSSGWTPSDQLHRELWCQLNDTRSKFASAVASASSAEQPAHKRARSRKEGRVMLRSLDSGEARVMSGLLTSLVQSNGSRLASAGRYKLVRSGKCSSSHDAKSPQVSHSKPLAVTPTKGLEETGTSECSEVPSSTHLPAISAPKTSTKRCVVCNTKTSLATSFHCRCGGNFCSLHRYAEAHGCNFDYRSEGRRLVEQNNPLVTAEKLPKI